MFCTWKAVQEDRGHPPGELGQFGIPWGYIGMIFQGTSAATPGFFPQRNGGFLYISPIQRFASILKYHRRIGSRMLKEKESPATSIFGMRDLRFLGIFPWNRPTFSAQQLVSSAPKLFPKLGPLRCPMGQMCEPHRSRSNLPRDVRAKISEGKNCNDL